jgi:hypothetical protein
MEISRIESQLSLQHVGLSQRSASANSFSSPTQVLSDGQPYQRSIFADSTGILVAQVKDHNGDVVAIYPSKEVLHRYELQKELK